MADIFDFDDFVYEPIDLCACYEPLFEPPAEQLEEWRRQREQANPFRCTVERKIGNTWYLDGKERLTDKVKRLVFSDKEVLCS